MNELDCQQLMIDAVEEIGGRGLKFNNRFIVGVVDLLLKLPGHEVMILEAKLHKFAPVTLERGYHIADIGATTKQKMYLRDWSQAGILTGVASFVMPLDGDVRTLRMALYSYHGMMMRHWSVSTHEHRPLGDVSERMTNIREQLIQLAGY